MDSWASSPLNSQPNPPNARERESTPEMAQPPGESGLPEQALMRNDAPDLHAAVRLLFLRSDTRHV